ncbi:hypothetical protein PR048_013622 [Dryococelus australis]|uniref:Uncharacterized protein n=1 Tax=Dryococelus australis TaxID=614101 RepID=A0ABQ9HT44_9NEOP|nr:hypothetical protein PR048_013622 [Dryococelus australis]
MVPTSTFTSRMCLCTWTQSCAMIQGNLVSAFSQDALSSVFAPKMMVVMLNNAAIGIITSFFLKMLTPS